MGTVDWFDLRSGYIGGIPANQIGTLRSGSFADSTAAYCDSCGKLMEDDTGRKCVTISEGTSFPRIDVCLACANYRTDLGRFETREDWIKESLDLVPETPVFAVIDLLIDLGRNKDAEWMRTHRSGQ